ncbi:TRAFAC clade GTPase domain-containing protein [Terriglobus albidus]|uniref:TRAFAC clade GTPase domain-containing protein n=1 Tax=Terriglobus albidus TaxID=1592106 RepID=UPI0021DF6CFB|nr:hypothetical protein [Terriglobus albidus]
MKGCKLALCGFGIDGKCIEGRGSACPNLINTLEDTSDEVTDRAALASNGDDVTEIVADNANTGLSETEVLHHGTALEIIDAREVTSRSRAILVSIAGMVESGKTSLLARFHQQFQMGSVGDYEFAGSLSLMRFEELNWRATVESGAHAPSMEHTSRRYDNSCLHVAVSHKDGNQPHIDLLLNDISGDTYPDAISALTVCENLMCTRRADHLAVVVDGGAMVDRTRRHDHASKALNFVNRLLQTGQIGPQTILHLIITKEDELKAAPRDSACHQAVHHLEESFERDFSHRVGGLHKWRVAARPMDGTLPTVDIITRLFSTFVSTTQRYPMPTPLPSSTVYGERDFSRYGLIHGDSE